MEEEGREVELGIGHVGFHEGVSTWHADDNCSAGLQAKQCLYDCLFKARARPTSKRGLPLLVPLFKVAREKRPRLDMCLWNASSVNGFSDAGPCGYEVIPRGGFGAVERSVVEQSILSLEIPI
jgi:hypothetical protein